MKRVYRVLIARDTEANQQVVTEEYYVASHISNVTDAIQIEMKDERSEVLEVKLIGPVLHVLN